MISTDGPSTRSFLSISCGRVKYHSFSEYKEQELEEFLQDRQKNRWFVSVEMILAAKVKPANPKDE